MVKGKASKASIRNLVKNMVIAGEEALQEGLLFIIKQGPSSVSQFLDIVGQMGRPAGEELGTMVADAISQNPLRYLEAGLEFLPSGAELDWLMHLVGPDSLRGAALRYCGDTSYTKAFRCADSLLAELGPAGGRSDHGLVLVWAEAWLGGMGRDERMGRVPNPERAVDVESALLEAVSLASGRGWSTEDGVRQVGVRALELLSELMWVGGRFEEFATAAAQLVTLEPGLAGGRVGLHMSDAILRGRLHWGEMAPPHVTVRQALTANIARGVRKSVQSQLDSISQIVHDLVKRADAIQESNEWALAEEGFKAGVMADRVVSEASIGHRRAIALTRHLQTAEDSELAECDAYPILLESLAFGPARQGLYIHLDLPRGLPPIWCDQGLLKIGLSESMAFLAEDVPGIETIEVAACVGPAGSVDLTLAASRLAEDISGLASPRSISATFESSLTRATLGRVAQSHCGAVEFGPTQAKPGYEAFRLGVRLRGCGQGPCPDRLPAGDPDLLGGVTRDVPGWQAELLSEAARYEAELSRETNQVLSILVHDMKNAFSFIQSWSEGLRVGGRDAAQSVTRIRENIARLRESAADAETMLGLNSEPHISFEDVAAVVDGILRSAQASADARLIRVERVHQPGIPKVALDRGRFESLLANLVKNALEATAPGGVVEVAVGADESRGLLKVAVRDSGCSALTPEDLDRSSTVPIARRGRSGTGVGLLAARRIASSHSGSLFIEPSIGGGAGTTVTFEMPLGCEEGPLSSRYPFRELLRAETLKALRTSIHFRASGDAVMARWLEVKALEAETCVRLSALVARDRLAPMAAYWVRGAVGARIVSPALAAHFRVHAGEMGLTEAERDGLEAAAGVLLYDIGRGKWQMDCSRHSEVAALLVTFCLPEAPARRAARVGVTLPGLTAQGVGELARAYARVAGLGQADAQSDLCRDGLRLLSGMTGHQPSDGGGGGVT